MRKIIAVMLAVLMLASALAMLPASAAGETAAKPELIITEVAQHTHEKDGLNQGAAVAAERAKYVGALGYVEVLNNTTGEVNLSNYSLLRAVNLKRDPGDGKLYHDQYTTWALEKKFINKMDLKVGNIFSAADKDEYYANLFPEGNVIADTVYNSLVNTEDDMKVTSGETAVIWFVTETTVAWLKAELEKDMGAYNARKSFVQRFYGAEANAADYNVIMVWAYGNWDLDDDSKPAKDMFTWEVPANDETNKSVIIALAEKNWSLSNNTYRYDASKIKSMVTIGNLIDDYVAATNNTAAVFVPASAKPFLKNKKNESAVVAQPVYNDYVEAGLAGDYTEVAAVLWGTEKTPGKISDWQYAMMASALNVTLPTTVDTAEKQTAAIAAFFVAEGFGEVDTGREETKVEIEFVDREELENIFFPSQPAHTHSYTSDCDTICNTCDDIREPLAPHTYQSACDATCKDCGKSRVVVHTYQSFCDATCNICGATRTINEKYHLYSAGCDTTCNRCGYERVATEHVYRTPCDSTCLICAFTRTVEGHVYDHACDAKCNTCSYERDIAGHTFDNNCDASCNLCPYKRLEQEHIYSSDRDIDCNSCGFIRGEDALSAAQPASTSHTSPATEETSDTAPITNAPIETPMPLTQSTAEGGNTHTATYIMITAIILFSCAAVLLLVLKKHRA